MSFFAFCLINFLPAIPGVRLNFTGSTLLRQLNVLCYLMVRTRSQSMWKYTLSDVTKYVLGA